MSPLRPPRPGPAPRRRQPWSSHPNMWRDPASVTGSVRGPCAVAVLAGAGALALAAAGIIPLLRAVTS